MCLLLLLLLLPEVFLIALRCVGDSRGFPIVRVLYMYVYVYVTMLIAFV